MFEESQGIFQNTRIQKGVIIPLDYRKLAGISSGEEEDTISAIIESQTSYSLLEDTTLAYVTQGTLDDFIKRNQ